MSNRYKAPLRPAALSRFRRCNISHPNLPLYLDGNLSNREKRHIEAHLAGCNDCRDLLAFIREFNQEIKELGEMGLLTTNEPCPDSWTFVHFMDGELDEETAQHIRAHLLFCDACQEDYYLLSGMTVETEAVFGAMPTNGYVN